jgi:arylsulfatase A-like enzyme
MPLLAPLFLAVLCALACTPAAPPQARNLILISIDTLRPGMLGSYGYHRPTSPMLDALAARGALFETAVSPSPWTLPAHASMLTGVYPKRHGLKSHDLALGRETPTLAERLQGHGFHTAAVVNSHNLSARYGMNRGFRDHFYVVETERRVEPSEVERVALEWLEAERSERFFLFLHYYDVHSDYRALPLYRQEFLRRHSALADGSTHQLRRFRRGELSLAEADAERLRDLYAGGIRQLDDGIARLVAALRERSALDDTLLVITSDHGEEFLEHGGVLHGRTQFDEVLRVPLILAGPGIPAGLRLAASVSLIDLLPTLVSLLGLPAPRDVDGIDLSPLLRGHSLPELADRSLFGEADRGNPEHDMTRSVRHRGVKGILDRTTGEIDVYDLTADPAEQRPIQRPALAERLRAEIEAFMADEVAPDPSRALEPLDPEAVERLKALGYL